MKSKYLSAFKQLGFPKKQEKWKYTSLYALYNQKDIPLASGLNFATPIIKDAYYILLADSIKTNIPKSAIKISQQTNDEADVVPPNNPDGLDYFIHGNLQQKITIDLIKTLDTPIYLYESEHEGYLCKANIINILASNHLVHIASSSKHLSSNTIHVAADATYTKVLADTSTYFIANSVFNINEHIKFSHNILSIGAGYNRHTDTYSINSKAKVFINGLIYANQNSHHDIYSEIKHNNDGSFCDQSIKAVAMQSSKSIFKGTVKVPKTTNNIESYQLAKNLLLDEQSAAICQPCLQIDQNDVQCSHGATIGALDADSLFFLTSRGIPLAAAKEMLIQAFIQDALAKVKLNELTTHLQQKLCKL